MSRFYSKILPNKTARGQSLVEMAIISPLLIFFLLGIFEVGWALRNYLVLVNVNREITRFAIRPGYMKFSTLPDVDASFLSVKEWAQSSVSEQLVLDFDTPDAATTLIVSHVVVDTGIPCADMASCNCNMFDPSHADYNPAGAFTSDDLIIHPSLPGYDYQQERFGPSATVTGPRDTRIDFATITADLRDKNNKFNCELMAKGGVPSANNVMVTELFHDQPQLFGFPLISNPFTDPVPLYTHTTMRLINAARSSGGVEGSIVAGIDNIGPICLVYPMLVDDAVSHGASVNIVANDWLKWNPSATPVEDYMALAVRYPQMSLNDFSPTGGVKINSSVDKVPGPFTGAEMDAAMSDLVGQAIIIPTSTSLGSDPVQVDGFVIATISSYDLAANVVTATVDKNAELPAACTEPASLP